MESQNSDDAKVVRLKVNGMTCGKCVQSVRQALEDIPGVVEVSVSLGDGTATVRLHRNGSWEENNSGEGVQATDVLMKAIESTGKTAMVLQRVREDEVDISEQSEVSCEEVATVDTEHRVERRYHCGCSSTRCCCSRVQIVPDDEGVLVRVKVIDLSHLGSEANSAVEPSAETSCCDDTTIDCACEVSPENVGSKIQSIPKKNSSSVGEKEVVVAVNGMSCASCVSKVEAILKQEEGVVSAKVSLMMARAVLRVSSGFDEDLMLQSLAAAGFKGTNVVTERDKPTCIYLRFSDKPSAHRAVEKLRRFPYVREAHIVADLQRCRRLTSSTADGDRGELPAIIAAAHRKLRSIREQASGRKQQGIREEVVQQIVRANLTSKRCDNHLTPKIIATRELTSLGFSYDVLSSADPVITGAEDAPALLARHAREYLCSFLFSLIFTFPLVFVTMVLSRIPTVGVALEKKVGASAISITDLVAWILATPVQFISGFRFYRGSWYALRNMRATMDVLIAVGTSTAYLFSVIVLIVSSIQLQTGAQVTEEAVAFETSALLITIVLLGKWLEARAKSRTAQSVAALAGLRPRTATVVTSPPHCDLVGSISVELVSKNDHVRVNAGDAFPVDGVVVLGRTTVNESMLSGESWPVRKEVGDEIYAGTVNGKGSIVLRCTATSSQGMLAKITELVEKAQASRAPVELFADKVSAVFVPLVVVISFLTIVVWFSLAQSGTVPDSWHRGEGKFMFAIMFGLSVLVISCPCALGLATPNVILIACELASKRFGILFKNGGEAIQAAKDVGVVLFDKTGTLTVGQPSVTSCSPLKLSESFEVRASGVLKKGSCDNSIVGRAGSLAASSSDISEDTLMLVGFAESFSDHPVAQAITSYVNSKTQGKRTFSLTSQRSIIGKGVECFLSNGQTIRVGQPAWIMELACARNGPASERNDIQSWEDVLDPASDALVREMQRAGQTVVFAGVDDVPVVVFGIEDPVRPEAKKVVDYLRTFLKLQCGMVTGDGFETAQFVAAHVGIDPSRIVARALPERKVREIEAVTKDPENAKASVVFVGDGINDAPSLACASVGVAMGSGSQVAAETADVVLVRSSLTELAIAIDFARTAFRKIKMNYVWALIYNCLGIPLAAGALFPVIRRRIPPWLAAAAMSASSLSVVLSSLSLRMYKPPPQLRELLRTPLD